MRTSASLLLAFALAAPAAAQTFPERTVRVIVPVPPGGIIDNSMRIAAPRLAARLGQQVIIENRPGANGAIGAQSVATSPADGYTVLAAVEGTMLVSFNPAISPTAATQTLRDFAPITRFGDFPLLLVGHPGLGAKNLTEFLAIAKAKPTTWPFGTAGIGSTPHLTGELLAQTAGIALVHVPYKGGNPAIADVLGGQIPLVFTTVPSAQQHVKAGKLVALGVTTAKRSATLPDAPTFVESGFADFDITGWLGIFAPAKTPAPIVERLQKELAAIVHDPGARNDFATLGLVPRGDAPAAFVEQIRAESARWAAVVKRGSIKLTE